MRAQLIQQLKNFVPFNEQEEKDTKIVISLLQNVEDIFLRSNLSFHMTASAWTINSNRDKALMCYHNIYNSYSWLGGHADGNENLLAVAIEEVQQESGIQNVKPVSNDIFSVEILTVDGHQKRGQYVPSHLHINITYLLQADENEKLKVKEDENSDVKWFSLEQAVAASSEPWFKEHIYSKLNAKLAQMKQEEK